MRTGHISRVKIKNKKVTPQGDPAKVGGSSGNVGTPVPKVEERLRLNDLRVPNGAGDVTTEVPDETNRLMELWISATLLIMCAVYRIMQKFVTKMEDKKSE